MASLSLAVLLLACCSFVSSGILPGPVRGYQYQQSYSSRKSQSYDSRTGAYSSVSVTSRNCNVIRRVTHYETVRVPFMCQVLSGRVAPLPPHMDSKKVQILNAMQAGGWSMCYKTIGVPLYRYQRIPVCCPGTKPTPDGTCISRKTGQTQPSKVPSPGQLLQSNTKIYNGGMDNRNPHPGYQYIPVTPTPVIVQAPRPYRGMLSRVPPNGFSPNSIIQQIMLELEGGQMLPPQLPRPMPVRARRPPAASPGTTDWNSDIARYLAAMMYQKLLVEQQQKILQDEISRQYRLRQQMEFIINQQRRLAQQQLQLQARRRQPTEPPASPNTDPSPIPSPPINVPGTTEAVPEEQSTAPPQTVETGGAVDEEDQDGLWSGGILDKMPHLRKPASTRRPPIFGNGPANIPPGTQTLPNALLEMKQKVKAMVDSCLMSSNINSPMDDILQSGDLNQLRPVCKASGTVGPCVMREAQDALGQDSLGMLGRQMMQSVLMSLGQLCMRLEKADQIAGRLNGDITIPPVFPNPAPSMTKAAVTEGTVETTSGDSPAVTQGNSDPDRQPAQPEETQVNSEAKADVDGPKPIAQNQPTGKPTQDPAVTPSAEAHSRGQQLRVAEAAFPMWMILAMVGACAALLFFGCITICVVLRCRRKKKTVVLDREPEKAPVPAEGNVYAATPCVPPPAYHTTPVMQTLGGGEEADAEMEDPEFRIPEDTGKAEASAPPEKTADVDKKDVGKEEEA